ncbi:MAG: triple tyrosine motif-containing protein, partial [Bacteroidota bacterium]
GIKQESLLYFNKQTGFPSNFIMSLERQPSGAVWVATNDVGLINLVQDSIAAHYTKDKGLRSNLIFNTYTDEESVTWVATNAGLARIQNGEVVKTYNTSDGLAQDALFDVIEDDFGKLWFTTSKGVFFIPKRDFYDYDNGKIETLHATVYNQNDGMAQEQCTGATQALKGRDGKLWFPTLGGVSMIDPANIHINELPPNVEVTGLKIDGQDVSLNQDKLIFPSDNQRYIFEFAALSFLAPDNVRFRYKLEGLEKEWTEAGNEGQTAYTNLPYGSYMFRVTAQNNDGIWNETGASLSFKIRPFFYQRTGFFIALAVLFLLLVTFFFRWRTRLAEQRAEQLEELVAERTEDLKTQTNKLAKSYDRMRVVSEVGQEVVGAGLNVEDILHAVQSNIMPVMDASVLAIGLHRKDSSRLKFWSI